MAPHAPSRRRKLANDLGAQAVSASGDQNLFHEMKALPNRVCRREGESTKGSIIGQAKAEQPGHPANARKPSATIAA
jgi:hypothetical protein